MFEGGPLQCTCTLICMPFSNMSVQALYFITYSTLYIIQLRGLPCPNQRVQAETYPLSNTSDITNHPEMAIKGMALEYPMSVAFKRKRLYTASVSIVGNKGVIETMRVNISKFLTFNNVVTT